MENYTIQEYLAFQEKVKVYAALEPDWIKNRIQQLGMQVLWRRIYFSVTGETVFYNDNYQLWKQLPWVIAAIGAK